jgi:hypothetical protein
MITLMSGGTAVGVLLIVAAWVVFITLLGVAIGARISRRRNRR